MGWSGNNNIFRTYLKGKSEGDGKGCADPHKGITSVRTWDECQAFDCFGAVLNEGWIDISFDSAEMGGKFLDMADRNDWRCLAIENPENHHIHTFWRTKKPYRNGEDKTLAVGFVADIHSGETYIPLRVYGVDRTPVYDIESNEMYQELPAELQPVNTTAKLWQQADGSGRNDELFSYILTLQKAGMDQQTIKRVLRNTNDFVFKDPLDQKELDTILRDESFQKPHFYDDKGRLLVNDFADYMVSQYHAGIINGQLHVYYDGHYTADQRDIERAMIEVIPNLLFRNRQEVSKFMWLKAEPKQTARPDLIAFSNGVLDLRTMAMVPESPDIVITNRIPHNYQPGAYSEIMDHTLDKISCNDSEVRALLLEMIGYCFYRKNFLRKAMVMVGGKRNGKSTILDVISALLGESNIAALDLSELGDRFRTAMLTGKLANIGDDIGDDFLQGAQVSIFKKIVAGNRITAEQKNASPFDFIPYTKLLFSANDIPRMKDRTGAVIDRLIIIPFDAKFMETDPDFDPNINEKLVQEDALEYLIVLAVDALKKLIRTKRFTSSSRVQAQLESYEEVNNPILGFLDEADPETDIEEHYTDEVYLQYAQYCRTNNTQQMTAIAFTKQIKERCGLDVVRVKVQGKSKRLFRRKK